MATDKADLINMLTILDPTQPGHKQAPYLKLYGILPNIQIMSNSMFRVLLHVADNADHTARASHLLLSDLMQSVAFMFALSHTVDVGDEGATCPAGEAQANRLHNEIDKVVEHFREVLCHAVSSILLPVAQRFTPEEIASGELGKMVTVVPLLRMLELISQEEYLSLAQLRGDELHKALDETIDRLADLVKGADTSRLN